MQDDVLAIHEPTYRAMAQVLELRARGQAFTREEAAAHAGLVAVAPAPRRQVSAGRGNVAVVPLIGFMTHRASFLSMLFGGTSTAFVAAEVRRAAGDPSVATIVIVTDSPGGEVIGTEELALAIAEAARHKRVTAAVDGMAASAAYYAISGASEIIATPSAIVGSIGVIVEHRDISKALERDGITPTIVTSAPYKAETHPARPLSTEARGELQRRVDVAHAMMVARIAAGRRTTVERVRTEYGQGRVLFAREALARGMVDLIGTVDDVLTGHVGGVSGSPRAGAADLELLRMRARHAELS